MKPRLNAAFKLRATVRRQLADWQGNSSLPAIYIIA